MCCMCAQRVDTFIRKADLDLLAEGKVQEKLLLSPSYMVLYVVRCHGEEGLLRLENDHREEGLTPR